MFKLESPEYLYLLALLPVLVALHIFSNIRRADGYKVKAVNEKSVNRFGEKTNFARYSIAE